MTHVGTAPGGPVDPPTPSTTREANQDVVTAHLTDGSAGPTFEAGAEPAPGPPVMLSDLVEPSAPPFAG